MAAGQQAAVEGVHLGGGAVRGRHARHRDQGHHHHLPYGLLCGRVARPLPGLPPVPDLGGPHQGQRLQGQADFAAARPCLGQPSRKQRGVGVAAGERRRPPAGPGPEFDVTVTSPDGGGVTTRFRGQVETAVRRLLKTMDVPAQQAVTHRWVERRLKGLSVCVSAPPEDTPRDSSITRPR